MLPSGNDAAFVLAEYFGALIIERRRPVFTKASHEERLQWDKLMQHTQFYANVNIRTFMKEMTKNAQALGMYDTFYDSPHGLRNERNFSTAYDVSLLTQECMKI